MKKPRGSIPMSPTRFFQTVTYQRLSLSTEEFENLKNTLDVDGPVDFMSKLEYQVYSTINELAKEVLVQEGTLSKTDLFFPKCTVREDEIKWIDNLKGEKTIELQGCLVFNYISPFKATFIYVGYKRNQYHTQTYSNIINDFSRDVIKTYTKQLV
ncbi:hypothetical protein [Priestia megaterium]|uniref:hypothetical protein n=1 Tax=Priestia megaterium TaxID=1404 RepID=UPI0025A338E6|nr:hypothetical protein [Priestia megaterium]MDM8151046.1 hypothetical protein [Priestia megaterium]